MSGSHEIKLLTHLEGKIHMAWGPEVHTLVQKERPKESGKILKNEVLVISKNGWQYSA